MGAGWSRRGAYRPLLVALAVVAPLAAARAEEVHLGADGVWRYGPPPAGEVLPDDYPSRPVIRGAPADALRALVPSYDEPGPVDPGWTPPGEAPYDEPGAGDPAYDALLPGEAPYDPPAWEDDPYDGPLVDVPDDPPSTGGYRLRAGPSDLGDGGDPGSRASVGPADGALPRLDDGPLFAPADPQQAEVPLPDIASVPGASALADRFALYAGAKRAALAEPDPGARLAAIRKANAFLVTLSRGDMSASTIRAVDLALGLTPVTSDSVQLPGGGTEVKRPDAKPTKADRAAARRLVDYGLLRNRGESAEAAAERTLGEPAALGPSETAGLDQFLGLDGGSFVTIYR
jgi:hypothetical protein